MRSRPTHNIACGLHRSDRRPSGTCDFSAIELRRCQSTRCLPDCDASNPTKPHVLLSCRHDPSSLENLRPRPFSSSGKPSRQETTDTPSSVDSGLPPTEHVPPSRRTSDTARAAWYKQNLNGHSIKDPQRNPVFFNEKSSRILEKKMRSLATRGLKGVRGRGVAELWIRSVG